MTDEQNRLAATTDNLLEVDGGPDDERRAVMTTDADLRAELDALRRQVEELTTPEGSSPCWCCGLSTPDRLWRRDSLAFGVGLGGAGLCPTCWRAQPSVSDPASRAAAALAGALGLWGQGRRRRERRGHTGRVANELEITAWIDAGLPATAERWAYLSTATLREADERIDTLVNPPRSKIGERRKTIVYAPGGTRRTGEQVHRWDGRRWVEVREERDGT